ncbi:MAG: hypothetical protein ACREQL_13575, partial [Candidatus Binatia bacterium]
MITARCEIAFQNPGSAPTWIDVTSFLRSFSISRGRSNELDRIQAGTAVVVLSNRDRRFDSTNTGSPYYPDIVPMRRIRLTAELPGTGSPFRMRSERLRDGASLRGGGTVTLALYQGFIEGWPQTWEDAKDSAVTVRAVDVFKLLSLSQFIWGERYTGTDTFVAGRPSGTNLTPATGTPHPPDDLTGARINRVLDTYGWPSAERDIDPGIALVFGSNVSLGGDTNIFVNATAIDHMQQAAAIEGGEVFVGADGKVTFRAPFVPDILQTWGDQTGEFRYRSISSEFDDSRLWNRIIVTVSPPLASAADAQ